MTGGTHGSFRNQLAARIDRTGREEQEEGLSWTSGTGEGETGTLGRVS